MTTISQATVKKKIDESVGPSENKINSVTGLGSLLLIFPRPRPFTFIRLLLTSPRDDPINGSALFIFSSNDDVHMYPNYHRVTFSKLIVCRYLYADEIYS